MGLLKYSVIKFIKSPSTWIVIFLGIVVAGVLAGWLPAKMATDEIAKSGVKNAASLKAVVLKSLIAVGGTLGMFSAIFAGFKGAQVFRSEIEDGTFLIMLSKPSSRRKVIFIKWLSFVIFMIFFQLISITAHNVGIILGDGTHTIAKEYLAKTCGIEIGLALLLGFIFSSVALLVSTFSSAGGTIGISMVLGLAIPITGIISIFTYSPGYSPATKVNNTNLFQQNQFVSRDSWLKNDDLPVLSDLEHYNDKLTHEEVSLDSGSGIYTYENLAWMDFNYQIAQLMTLATDKIMTQKEKDLIASSNLGHVGTINYLQKETGELGNDFYNKYILERNPNLSVGLEDIREEINKLVDPHMTSKLGKYLDAISGDAVIENNVHWKDLKLPSKWVDYDASKGQVITHSDANGNHFWRRYDEKYFESQLKKTTVEGGSLKINNNGTKADADVQTYCQDVPNVQTEKDFKTWEKTHKYLSVYEYYCNILRADKAPDSSLIQSLIFKFMTSMLANDDDVSNAINGFYDELKRLNSGSGAGIVRFIKTQIGLETENLVKQIDDKDKNIYVVALPILYTSNFLTKKTEYLMNSLVPYANNFHAVNGNYFGAILLQQVSSVVLDSKPENKLDTATINNLMSTEDEGVDPSSLPKWWKDLSTPTGAAKYGDTKKEIGYTLQDLVRGVVSHNYLKTIEYVPFIRSLTLFWVYLALSIALVPVSYLIVSRQNFR